MSASSSLLQDTTITDDWDIEYNIAFPSSSCDSLEQEPVVFLLGHVGMKDKVLAKYSLFYEKTGCITIRYIHPSKSSFYQDPSESTDHILCSEKLIQLLEDYDLIDHPVFIHVLSNGGYYIYRFMADLLHKQNFKMIGVVLDSCPAKSEFLVAAKAIMAPGVAPNMFAALTWVFAFAFVFIFTKLKRLFRRCHKDVYDYMKESRIHLWPHLFLYSKLDVIVPISHVVEMAERRKEAGAHIALHDFQDSPHVMHFRHYADIYEMKCITFLKQCLNDYLSFDTYDTAEGDISEQYHYYEQATTSGL